MIVILQLTTGEKKKLGGQNPLNIGSTVHEHRNGDQVHHDQDKMYTFLGGLKQQMKDIGYTQDPRFGWPRN